MSSRIRRAGGPEVVSRRISTGHAFPRENPSICYRAGLRFLVGMSLAFGQIGTRAAFGDHDGSFAPPVHYATGDTPASVAIGDLDGDQVLDLVLANEQIDSVAVLLGVGDGTFVTAVNYAADDRTKFVAIGDLNGDQVLGVNAIPS